MRALTARRSRICWSASRALWRIFRIVVGEAVHKQFQSVIVVVGTMPPPQHARAQARQNRAGLRGDGACFGCIDLRQRLHRLCTHGDWLTPLTDTPSSFCSRWATGSDASRTRSKRLRLHFLRVHPLVSVFRGTREQAHKDRSAPSTSTATTAQNAPFQHGEPAGPACGTNRDYPIPDEKPATKARGRSFTLRRQIGGTEIAEGRAYCVSVVRFCCQPRLPAGDLDVLTRESCPTGTATR